MNIFFLKFFNKLDKLLMGDAQVFFDPIIPIGIKVAQSIINRSIHGIILHLR